MMRAMLSLALLLGIFFMPASLAAADKLVADHLDLAGISFDDPPLALPVTPNLQQALNQIAGDIGRHCTTSAAYGWRLAQTEQQRVNTIFSNTAAHLNAAGFNLAPQTPPSATRDITIFLAQHSNRELLFMWSAGELGLVLLVCDAQSGIMLSDKPVTSNTTELQTQTTNKPAGKVGTAAKPKPVAKKPVVNKAGKKTVPAAPVEDLPPVIHETAQVPVQAAPPADTKTPEAAVSPEVKAMLESLPEKPPVAMPATTSESAPAPAPIPDAVVAPTEVPTMVVPPTQE